MPCKYHARMYDTHTHTHTHTHTRRLCVQEKSDEMQLAHDKEDNNQGQDSHEDASFDDFVQVSFPFVP